MLEGQPPPALSGLRVHVCVPRCVLFAPQSGRKYVCIREHVDLEVVSVSPSPPPRLWLRPLPPRGLHVLLMGPQVQIWVACD